MVCCVVLLCALSLASHVVSSLIMSKNTMAFGFIGELFFGCVGFLELLDLGGVVIEHDLNITQTGEVAQQPYT